MAEIVLEGVHKVFEDGTRALHDLNLRIDDGEFMVLVGPSGCGKTTALRLIAGLDEPTQGTIRIGDRIVNGVHPKDRDVAMVFQNYALYPHMSVFENMAFGLRRRKIDKDEVIRRVEQAAEILDLMSLLQRRPKSLSGGQRQRVAMGRAIVREPQVFLMDEPLSNLDANLRVLMRSEIARIQTDLGVTTVYVTHDQVEAMTMGDRVALLHRGELQQIGTPQELYERPVNILVARFIGSPIMNMARVPVRTDDGSVFAVVGERRLPLETALAQRPGLARYVGREVALGIRPEDMHVADGTGDGDGDGDIGLRAAIDFREPLGSDLYVHFTVPAPPVLIKDVRKLIPGPGGGSEEDLVIDATSRQATFIARLKPNSRVRIGDVLELVADPARLYFFDLETGEGVYA